MSFLGFHMEHDRVHDRRCEQSKAPNRRCRCECKGTQHGIAAVRNRLALEEQTEEKKQ